MAKGFFSTSKLKSTSVTVIRSASCGKCGLYQTCQSPKMPVTGKGKLKILVVAEAPGRKEDEQNEQLIGESGQLLRDELDDLDIDLDEDCWKTNAIICRPPDNVTPTDDQIRACRPHLLKTIRDVNPVVVICLGNVALRSLIGHLWKESINKLGQWVGFKIPSRNPNMWVVPTFHPSYLLRQYKDKALALWFRKHIEAAVALKDSRPWDADVKDYADEVEVEMSGDRAALWLREIRSGTIAFDYETNCLKPEYEGSKIYTCSVCWNGKRTVAFPWRGEVIAEMRKLLHDHRVGKVAANLKFEDRWTRYHLKMKVRRWVWDTMISAHVNDNRRGITALKFQAYVYLGCPSYDDDIRPYLESGKKHRNRIDQVDLNDLLLYNGLDSLLEYRLMRIQRAKVRTIEPGVI